MLVQPVSVVNMPSLCRISTLYPVIAEPPFAAATQFIIKLLPEITEIGAAGVLGVVKGIIAPLPSKEKEFEKPTAFFALTLA